MTIMDVKHLKITTKCFSVLVGGDSRMNFSLDRVYVTG